MELGLFTHLATGSTTYWFVSNFSIHSLSPVSSCRCSADSQNAPAPTVGPCRPRSRDPAALDRCCPPPARPQPLDPAPSSHLRAHPLPSDPRAVQRQPPRSPAPLLPASSLPADPARRRSPSTSLPPEPARRRSLDLARGRSMLATASIRAAPAPACAAATAGRRNWSRPPHLALCPLRHHQASANRGMDGEKREGGEREEEEEERKEKRLTCGPIHKG